MNEEKILDALEFIDEQYIEDVYALKQTPKKRKNIWKKAVSLAACVALVFVSVIFLNSRGYIFTEKNQTVGSSQSKGEPEQAADISDSNGKDEAFDNSDLRDNVSTVQPGESYDDSDDVCMLIPAYVEITQITDNGFILKVIDNRGLDGILTENQEYQAVYDTDYKQDTANEYKVGDKVYITYGTNEKENPTRIYIKEIYYGEALSQ